MATTCSRPAWSGLMTSSAIIAAATRPASTGARSLTPRYAQRPTTAADGPGVALEKATTWRDPRARAGRGAQNRSTMNRPAMVDGRVVDGDQQQRRADPKVELGQPEHDQHLADGAPHGQMGSRRHQRQRQSEQQHVERLIVTDGREVLHEPVVVGRSPVQHPAPDRRDHRDLGGPPGAATIAEVPEHDALELASELSANGPHRAAHVFLILSTRRPTCTTGIRPDQEQFANLAVLLSATCLSRPR